MRVHVHELNKDHCAIFLSSLLHDFSGNEYACRVIAILGPLHRSGNLKHCTRASGGFVGAQRVVRCSKKSLILQLLLLLLLFCFLLL